MSEPSRRQALRRAGALLTATALAGCSGMDGIWSTPAERGGYIVSTSVVETPPKDADVVDYDSSRLQGASSVKSVVEETYEDGGLFRDVTVERYEELDAELSELPYYDGDTFGYYFQYRETVIRIRLLVES